MWRKVELAPESVWPSSWDSCCFRSLSLATGSVMFVPLFALPAMFILSGMLFGGGDSPPGSPRQR